MAAPKVSVLMPVYNGERYVRETIASILAQTFREFDLIIMDDGSIDGTFDILQSLAKQDGRIQLLRNEVNVGIVRTMNTLFGLATGEYINRHDADDISLPDRFEQQVSFLDENPKVGLVSCRIQLIDVDGAPLEHEMFASPLDNASLQRQLMDHCCLCQSSVMFRRSCLDIVGLYKESFEPSEDYDLWLRMAEVTQLAKLPEKLFCYRRHPGSVSSTRNAEQLLRQAMILESACQRRFGPEIPSDHQVKLGYEYFRAAIAHYQDDQKEAAHKLLLCALAYDAHLLDSLEPLEGLITDYRHSLPTTSLISFGESLFADLFRDVPAASHLKPRFLSRLHMREVFAGAQENDADRVDHYIGKGLQYDPAWLLNRGVLVITAKSILRSALRKLGIEPVRPPA